MANEHESRMGHDASGVGSFLLGLAAGTAIGAALALLFAPRPGRELRTAIGETANEWGRTVSEQYGKVVDVGRRAVDTSKGLYTKARSAVGHGTAEPERMTTEAMS